VGTEEPGYECDYCGAILPSEEKLRSHRKNEHAGKVCSYCGSDISKNRFNCNYCHKSVCADHRLPENHDCESLEKAEEQKSGPLSQARQFSGGRSVSNPQEYVLCYVSRVFEKARSKKLTKLMPLLGIGLVFVLTSRQGQTEGVSEMLAGSSSFGGLVSSVYKSFTQSLINTGTAQIAITGGLLFTIWSAYQYWLKDWRYTRKSRSILEKITLVSILLSILGRHIDVSTTLGGYADWLMFLLVLYLELAVTWFLAKSLDNLDLSSDLLNWSLRLLGLVTMFIGAVVFTTFSASLLVLESDLVFSNVYWIAGVCLMLLGAFMEYRSFRRHPAVKVW
jgi:hypothetical protein